MFLPAANSGSELEADSFRSAIDNILLAIFWDETREVENGPF